MVTELPPWVKASLDAMDLEINDVLLCPPIQEKDALSSEPSPMWDNSTSFVGGHRVKAGFTCGQCPNPYRPIDGGRSRGFAHVGKEQKLKRLSNGTLYTQRCTRCDTSFRNWKRGRADADMLSDVRAALRDRGEKPMLVFVTLTVPNVAVIDHAEAIRALKSQVKTWKRTQTAQRHFAGGLDFYEVTARFDWGPNPNVTLNVHHHGIWIRKERISQADLQDSWGYRVDIRRVKDTRKMLRYVTAYAGKDPIPRVRTKESWGVCRKSARVELGLVPSPRAV